MKPAYEALCGSQEEILDTVIPRAAANLCLLRDLVVAARGICFLASHGSQVPVRVNLVGSEACPGSSEH
jgi:hypothetical protein